MKKLVEVTKKSGQKIMVLSAEIPGLKKAGILRDSKVKEEKDLGETKEFKDASVTKSIIWKNIKGKRPKKT